MECKAGNFYSYGSETLIKVEPYWNVKTNTELLQQKQRAIKVEPYWNVKKIKSVFEEWAQRIKVEPYWNVKSVKTIVGLLYLSH